MTPARLAAAVLLAGGLVSAQAAVPPAGLAAEGEGRWADALSIYQRAVTAEPDAAVWARIADIHARLGRKGEAAEALNRAAGLRPRDAALQARASQAYATAGKPGEALAAAQRAQALEPDSVAHLRAVAELAGWAGDPGLAERSYTQLLRREPQEPSHRRARARLLLQAGRLEEAATDYAAYRSARADDLLGWVEGATVEEFRGDFAAAAALLAQARKRFGASEALAQADAELLARAGRDQAALERLPGLIADDPDRYELHLLRTLALEEGGQSELALESLGELERLGARRPETASARLQVETPRRASLAGGGTWYDDTAGIGNAQGTLSAGLTPWRGARLSASVAQWQLSAPAGSIFVTAAGDDRLRGQTVQGLLHQQLLPGVALRVAGGSFQPDSGPDRALHELTLELHPGDAVDLEVGRVRDVLMASPLSASLGIERDLDRLRLRWRQGYRGTAEVAVTASDQSDANQAFELDLTQRFAVRRTSRYNLDLGLRAQHLEYDRHAGNGYYDPEQFRRYQALASSWLKLGDQSGLGFGVALGPERDRELDDSYVWGGDARVEGLFGAYRDWQLRVHASYGGRFDGTPDLAAWRGSGAGLELTRRF